MSNDILTIKGSELRHASSEEIELQGIGFGESDDGLGLDNFRFYLYTRETVDRLNKETNDRINYMYAVDMVNTFGDQSVHGQKNFEHLQGLNENLIWNMLGELVVHSDGQRDTFGRNNAIARIRSEFVPRWVKPDGSVETFLTDVDGGNILDRIDEVDSDSRERDEQLQRNIDDVERGSVIRDNLLQTNIDNEELARKDEDTRLHERINHMYDEDMVNTYEDQSINGVKRFERVEAQTDDVIGNKDGDTVIVSDALRDTFGRNNAITRLRSSEIPRWVKPDGSAETFLTESHGSDIGDALDQLEQQINTVDSESRQRDQVLQDNIDTEESARIAADQQLQSNIDDEESARIAADEQLQSNIDAEELARINADEALQEEIDENAAEITRLDNSKEDNIPYGDPGQVAVVNDTGTGFDFIPAPSFDILKIRGAISEYTEGTDPNIFAVVSGDSLNSHLYKDTSPNSPDGDATGFAYIATEEFDAEISDGAGEITITAGDFLIWSEVVGEWTHVPVQTGARVDAINNLTGYVELVGSEGITISVNTENGRITIGIDATIARQADLLALAQRVAVNEEDIYDLLEDMVYVTNKLVELEGSIGDNATAIAEVTQRVGVNESNIETLFEDFDTHINDDQNPHGTTYDQVGAAAAVHEHTASQISDFNTAADARVRISYVGTGSEHDPDTDLAPQFISNHANSPDSTVYWHITQRFYTSASSDSNRTQLAIEYNTTENAPPRVAVRTHFSDVWTDWRFLGEGEGSVEWDDVLNKPSTFPPSAHTHAMGEITDLDPTTLMRTIGDQTVGGTKTFSVNPISTAEQSAAGNALTRRDYVDGNFGGLAASNTWTAATTKYQVIDDAATTNGGIRINTRSDRQLAYLYVNQTDGTANAQEFEVVLKAYDQAGTGDRAQIKLGGGVSGYDLELSATGGLGYVQSDSLVNITRPSSVMIQMNDNGSDASPTSNYMQWVNANASRRGFFGYGGASETLTIRNDNISGEGAIDLNNSAMDTGRVAVQSLCGNGWHNITSTVGQPLSLERTTGHANINIRYSGLLDGTWQNLYAGSTFGQFAVGSSADLSTAANQYALFGLGQSWIRGQLNFNQDRPTASNQADIFHNGATAAAHILRSMRENNSATWVWETIQSGQIRYSTGTNGAGATNLTLHASQGNVISNIQGSSWGHALQGAMQVNAASVSSAYSGVRWSNGARIQALGGEGGTMRLYPNSGSSSYLMIDQSAGLQMSNGDVIAFSASSSLDEEEQAPVEKFVGVEVGGVDSWTALNKMAEVIEALQEEINDLKAQIKTQ